MLAVFISENVYAHKGSWDIDSFFCVKEYNDCEILQPCDFIAKKVKAFPSIKAFPLIPKLVENDFPAWEGSDIPEDIRDEILRLEEENGIEYFNDICEDLHADHKIGGYPSYIQGGSSFGNDYEFVFQISSDDKACLNIIDGGSFNFFKNPHYAEDWMLHYDFY